MIIYTMKKQYQVPHIEEKRVSSLLMGLATSPQAEPGFAPQQVSNKPGYHPF